VSSRRTVQDSPAVWKRDDVERDRSWEHRFTEEQRDELVAATRAALDHGLSPATITRDSFPLPALTDSIREWHRELSSGRGFLLLHGFPHLELDEIDERAAELAYVGLGTHVGTPVGQNRSGDLLTHIRDERLPPGPGKVRLYRTRARQEFHTDGADVIGLLCLHRARSGGESRIVSSLAVYNELLRTRPDLLEVLYEPMYWDRQDEEGPGEKPWFMLPPITDLAGVPRVFYIGWYLRDAQRHADVPRLTAAQADALDTLERIANDPAFHLEMDFAPGDIQFLNNGRILHSREAYEDDDDPAERRHLLRLWLAAHSFTSVDDGLRTGINTPGR
jgi:hypothetical protein